MIQYLLAQPFKLLWPAILFETAAKIILTGITKQLSKRQNRERERERDMPAIDWYFIGLEHRSIEFGSTRQSGPRWCLLFVALCSSSCFLWAWNVLFKPFTSRILCKVSLWFTLIYDWNGNIYYVLMVIKRVYALLVVLLNLIEVILIRTESATEETAVLRTFR